MSHTESRLKPHRTFVGYFGQKDWKSVTQKERRAEAVTVAQAKIIPEETKNLVVSI